MKQNDNLWTLQIILIHWIVLVPFCTSFFFYKVVDILLVSFFDQFWKCFHTDTLFRLDFICYFLNTVFIFLVLTSVAIFICSFIFIFNNTLVCISVMLITRFLVLFNNSIKTFWWLFKILWNLLNKKYIYWHIQS